MLITNSHLLPACCCRLTPLSPLPLPPSPSLLLRRQAAAVAAVAAVAAMVVLGVGVGVVRWRMLSWMMAAR